MLSGRIFLLYLAIIIVLCASVYYFFIASRPTQTYPNPSAVVNLNPGFVYSETGPFSDLGVTDWDAKRAYYNKGEIEGRKGFVTIHPISLDEGNYIQQDVFLPADKNYELKVSLNDIAGKAYFAGGTDCADVRFVVKIISKEDREEYILSDTIVNSLDGWVDLTFDVSDYAGKSITMRLESHAGGPCGMWHGEWATVDYFGLYEK